jgi:hypothetical protein
VHGARSRFLTEPVLACFDRAGPPPAPQREETAASAARADVAGRLRSMW